MYVLPKKWNNFRTFVIASFIAHFILGIALFYSHNQSLGTLNIHATAHNVKVRVLPFGHKKPTSKKVTGLKNSSSGSTAIKPATSSLPSTTTILQKKSSPKKKLKKKKQASHKKNREKTVPTKKKLPEKITETLKTQPVEHKEALPVPEQKISSDNVTPKMPVDDFVYVTQEEFESLKLGTVLQEAITNTWSPPPGIDVNVECLVKITINNEGKILETIFEKTSGIRLYDVTVERALPMIAFPVPFWGKSFTLCFKP